MSSTPYLDYTLSLRDKNLFPAARVDKCDDKREKHVNGPAIFSFQPSSYPVISECPIFPLALFGTRIIEL